MSEQQLLTEAKNTLFNLKKEEQWNLTPYASFANQVIGLIAKKKIISKEGVLEYTRLSYPRPGLNRQWRKFGNILENNLRSNLNKEELLLFFGYLKRVLTIAAKNQADEKYNNRGESHRPPGKNGNRPHGQGNKKR
jgi:hypothetical protein